MYRLIYRVAAGMLVALITGCSGGGGGGGETTAPTYEVWITSPSSSGIYQTDRTFVSVEGGSFAPAGGSCPAIVGVMPPGYAVTWSNAATGTTDDATAYLNCLLKVFVIWKAPVVPLAMGGNPITVTARDASGHTGQATIVVTRVADTTPPQVISTSPVAGATDVSVRAAVIAQFSETMNRSTITAATVILKDSHDNPIAASVYYDDTATGARLVPSNPLSFSTVYTATVTTGVSDEAGNALAAPYTFSFTTGASQDQTSPSVQSVSPPNGSSCAPTAGAVTATFDEDLDPATVNANTFSLIETGGTSVPGAVTYVDRTASFAPATALTPGVSYTASLAVGIADLAGNQMGLPYQWSFTTLDSSQGVGTWSPTSLINTPFARFGHVAAWTGSEMIVAGGLAWDSDWNRFDYTTQYGRYDPSTGNWSVSNGAPTGAYQVAVWTGSRMLVWGGYASGIAQAGGASFDPNTNSWTPLATANQPSPRIGETAVWTGSEMVIWGGRSGYGGTVYGDGARYNPATNTWQPISAAGAPSPRYDHSAVWAGTEMIVWGGAGDSVIVSDGARYNPLTDRWTAITNAGAPSARYGHVAVWTGSKMIIWGSGSGSTNTGGLYDPGTDTWAPTAAQCAPAARQGIAPVWTGTRMIVWGGGTGASVLSDGYEYDPAANAWSKIADVNAPLGRFDYSAVWGGNKMIIWGGSTGTVLNDGAVLSP